MPNRILIISSLTDADPIEDRYIGDLADSKSAALIHTHHGCRQSGHFVYDVFHGHQILFACQLERMGESRKITRMRGIYSDRTVIGVVVAVAGDR